MNQQIILKGQSVSQISPIDPKQIVEHGESPTAIILAIAILISMLFSSLSWMLWVILAARSSR